MRWDAVLQAVGTVAAQDVTLAALFPATGIRMATGAAEHQVPLLEFLLVADAEDELWAPCTVQWSIWAEDLATVRAAERQLRRLFHADLPVTIGGVSMFTQYLDGDVLAFPDRDGYHGRAIRFRHTPLREQYAGAP